MTNLQPIKVYVRYLGIFRLMSGRKEDVFKFSKAVVLSEVLSEMCKLLPDSLCKQLMTQTLMLSPELGRPGRVLHLGKDSNTLIEDGSCITVVTPVTGG